MGDRGAVSNPVASQALIESARAFARDQTLSSFVLAGSTPHNVLPATDYPSACEELCVGLEGDILTCPSVACMCNMTDASGQTYILATSKVWWH